MTTSVTALSDSKVETFFERHAWKVFLAVSLIIGIFGVGDMVGGRIRSSEWRNGLHA